MTKVKKGATRDQCDDDFGHNLKMSCKYIINSKGLTFNQCLQKANMMTKVCKLTCFLGFYSNFDQCKIPN